VSRKAAPTGCEYAILYTQERGYKQHNI